MGKQQKFDWIIFTKDRAMQLDLLLRSMQHHKVPQDSVRVIYNTSHNDYVRGYMKAFRRHGMYVKNFADDVNGFDKALRALVQMAKGELIGLLCDDDVFVNPITENLHMDEDTYTFSLRLNPYMDYSLNSDAKQEPVNVTKWCWEDEAYDYGYPNSVSCSIWRKADLLKMLNEIRFRHPNSLEDAMIRNSFDHYPAMQCFEVNPMLNIPANRVQHTHANPTIGYSAEELNKMWLDGKEIDLEPLIGIKSNSPFLDYQYTFK